MLSVVIIGRNESENLPRLSASINLLRQKCTFPVETIFVDSASEDDSVDRARTLFDQVYEIVQDKHMCASAGRYVGTTKASFEWVFYIDADMEICPEFISVIADLPQAPVEWDGVVGDYVHHFHDGSVAVQTHEGDIFKSDWAAAFGGAVILRREAVLRAGNWNPAVFGKEEMNLYSRLGGGKRVVWYEPCPMINHYSENYTRFELFKRLLFPSAGQGKVFYGYGQSVRALLQAGKLLALIRLEPEPYIVWLLIVCGITIAAFLPLTLGLLLLFAEILLLSVWLRPGPLIRFLTLPLQILTGWNKYAADYRPSLRSADAESIR